VGTKWFNAFSSYVLFKGTTQTAYRKKKIKVKIVYNPRRGLSLKVSSPVLTARINPPNKTK
jgi:hypothetical protein